MESEVRGPLVLYVDHEKKEMALSFGVVGHLFSPIEVIFRGTKELLKIKRHFEDEGYQYTGIQFMKNSTEPEDGKDTIKMNISAIPSH